jgi:membrane protease YdiL (CAAX protease family)
LSDPRPGPGEDLPVPIDLPDDAVLDDAVLGDGAPVGPAVPPSWVRPGPFTVDGRVAPGLYLVGWLGTLVGLGASFAGISGGAGPVFLIGLVILTLGLLAGAGAQALERSRWTDQAYRGPSPWLVFAATISLSLAVQVLIVIIARALGISTTLPLLTTILLAATALVYVAVVRLLVVGTGALTWTEMGLRIPAPRVLTDLAFGAAFALPVLVFTGAVAVALSQVFQPPPNPLPEALSPFDLAANLLSAAVIAPIGEELFFRGYATTAWERSAGARSAILRGAFLFAFAHVLTLGDVWQALFAFIVRLPVALMLGWVFLQRRSLPASIGLHAAFNGIQVLLLAAATQAGPPG